MARVLDPSACAVNAIDTMPIRMRQRGKKRRLATAPNRYCVAMAGVARLRILRARLPSSGHVGDHQHETNPHDERGDDNDESPPTGVVKSSCDGPVRERRREPAVEIVRERAIVSGATQLWSAAR